MITKKDNRILPKIGDHLFSPPYLPRAVVAFTLIIIITDACVYLISQPLGYWKNHAIALSAPDWLYRLTTSHPLHFSGVMLAYIIILGLILEGLSRVPALILWFAVSFYHINNLFNTNVRNLIVHQQFFNETTRYYLTTILAIVIVTIIGIIIANRLPSQKASTDDAPSHLTMRINISPRVKAVLFVAWLILIAGSLIASINAPVPGWHLIPSDVSPSAIIGSDVTYDSKREHTLLFGGAVEWDGYKWNYVNETWKWDGTNWEQLLPENSPTPRTAMAIAYDEKRDVVVLFGGGDENGALNDTWEWDGQEWHQLFPTNPPLAREGHEMVYDPQRQHVVFYGGFDRISTFFNDAWEWDGEEWLQIDFETTSPLASGYAMAFDSSTDQIMTFLSGYPGGTWVWDDDRWSQLQPTTIEPSDRTSTNLAYDPENNQMIMFGGAADGQGVNDTWAIDGQNWQKLHLSFTPSARWGHTTFYDPNRKRIIIYGGIDESNEFREMYEFIFPKDIK